MNASAFLRIKEAYLAVRSLRDQDRKDFLVDLEAQDPALFRAVCSFLDYETQCEDPAALVPTPMDETEAPALLAGTRYDDLGRIGSGGMGEVRRVYDPWLDRTLALKYLQSAHHHSGEPHRTMATERFIREAKTQARLQHPGIVPIHERDVLPDGRPYLTMTEVQGSLLEECILEVHEALSVHQGPSPSGWTVRRLVAAFEQVCRAMAYAHDHGVIHRDLKPQNVMLGEFGEAVILDWGLAKSLEDAEPEILGDVDNDDIIAPSLTRPGTISGTPGYLSPEQARGETDIDARSDVFSLGAILYQILSGRTPYTGTDAWDVLEQVRRGPPETPAGRADGVEAIPELVEICERAMVHPKDDRYPTAEELADDVRAWLDGALDRERAQDLLAEAEAKRLDAEALRARADACEAESETALASVRPWDDASAKTFGWALADEAARLRREADLRELGYRESLSAALENDPSFEEAHTRLVDYHLHHLRTAEARRDYESVAEHEALIRRHDIHGRCAAVLEGIGALTIVTEPPGAAVHLYRFEDQDRRKKLVFEQDLGPTPLVSVALPRGSYLCVLVHPDRPKVTYPIEIERLGHWDGVPPGERDPQPIWLPPTGYVDGDAAYVPPGWFRSGADRLARGGQRAQRLWCEGFIMAKAPITQRTFAPFLRDHPQEGLSPTPHSDVPVTGVPWSFARSFALWLGEQTGHPWRIPGELEWEKAARGVDGRWYPMGDYFDPSWAWVRATWEGQASRPQGPVPIAQFASDVGPYGITGLAGNVRDWTLSADGRVHGQRIEPPPLDEPARTAASEALASLILRGGSWDHDPTLARAAARDRARSLEGDPGIGFRVARSVPPQGSPTDHDEPRNHPSGVRA
ncbi:MAG: SUMF1/EgtB/PvdO family nonheme iron enzyme [Myxococcota bacterium]